MKYESELIKEIVDTKGHEKSLPHYESECIETWIDEAKGAYPKLTDYRGEWLNYMVESPIGEFPYITLSDVSDATVDNVVPYAYKSAILSGSTKYRDIDTGEILETFEEGRNIELISVKKPVLTTTGKNLFDGKLEKGLIDGSTGKPSNNDTFVRSVNFIKVQPNKTYVISEKDDSTNFRVYEYDENFNYIDSRSKKTFTTHSNTYYIKFRTFPKNSGDDVSRLDFKVMLETEDTATPYEPHKSNILTVNEEVELRGVGDVEDELDCLTGEVTQRVGEIVLDGTQDMFSDGYGVYIQVNDAKRFLDYTDKIACDKLPVIPTYWELENVENGISGYANSEAYLGQNWLYVKINNSINTDEVKEWLTQNPITVQYQRATESVKTVDLLITNQDGNTLSKIKPIEGTMHLATSSDALKPTFSGEIPVEATTQNLASFIEE